jgi:Arc/MetJ-type ribon-helix-helix transcriptional regulator
MTLILTPEVEDRIQRWIDNGGFPNAGAVIERALQALEEQEHAKHVKLREMVRTGFESGLGVELTDDVWEEIAREADEADRQGMSIRREVQP